MDWIKTDDFQYCRKIEENKYEFIGANYIESDEVYYGICEPKEIDLNDWIKNGEYTDDCKVIISAYYGGFWDGKEHDPIKEFETMCVDIDTRKQVLAEMIYEETYRYMDAKYGRVTEEEAERILKYYVETDKYLEQ